MAGAQTLFDLINDLDKIKSTKKLVRKLKPILTELAYRAVVADSSEACEAWRDESMSGFKHMVAENYRDGRISQHLINLSTNPKN